MAKKQRMFPVIFDSRVLLVPLCVQRILFKARGSTTFIGYRCVRIFGWRVAVFQATNPW